MGSPRYACSSRRLCTDHCPLPCFFGKICLSISGDKDSNLTHATAVSLNKMVNGKQCAVLWHVDDLKLSHVDGSVNEDVLGRLSVRYGKETPITVTRSNMHHWLGMTIDCGTEGKVRIRMDDYVESMLEEVPDNMNGTAATPAVANLFKVDANAEDLCQEESEVFHSGTAKLLFLCKRARLDIQMPITFLCAPGMKPNVSDYNKLQRVVKCLRGSKLMCLTLESDDLQIIKWWVDASSAVHEDMRSHTGGTVTLGKGSVCSSSIGKKLNTKSLTEAELVGADDMMPMILWTRQFIEGQGYAIKDNIVHQENQTCNVAREEWATVKQEANLTFGCSVFLRC